MQISIVDRTGHLARADHEFAKRRLLFALCRFDSRIDRVRAVIQDVNGPSRGVHKHCRITVTLRRCSNVSISSEDADTKPCLARAADRVGRAVSRAIARLEQARR